MTADGVNTSYSYNAANQLTGSSGPASIAYTYDNAGNLLTESTGGTATARYTYNADNQLTSVQTETNRAVYTYHPNGLRKTKATYNASNVLQNSTTYTWSGDALVMETVGNANKRYFYGLDLVAGTSGTTATTNYFTHDAHGSVALTTNSSGAAVQPYEYDAFGNLLNPASSDANPFRYSGEYFDSETGNYYLRARYYDPGIGRFTQQDTAKDGINWYIYCNNNPVSFVDPTGLSGILADGTYYITHHLDQRLLELKQEYATASDERKKEIAFEAQAIRDSGTEGIDWSVSANKSLDYYIIDTDITDKLNGLMDEVGSKHFYKRFARIPLTVELMRYLDFANMVRPGGIYDLKAQAEWQGKEHYIYNGNIVWFDAPGNILYGYLGKSMGFSDLVLYAAPGVAQIAVRTSSWNFAFSFFDDPRDQENIRLGIQIFRETHSVIWW